MLDTMNKIMNIMNDIEYGFKDENGFNINSDPEKWDNEFDNFYYLQTPEELLKSKCGVCWCQVELERELFSKEGIEVETYFICTYDNDNSPSHTFLVIKDNNKYYWFEHSWGIYKGIHEYDSLKELLLDVKEKFIKSNPQDINNDYTFVYKYENVKYHISCKEFYDFIETQELIKLNEPLYFYHLVNKDADMSKGILSLQYMYDYKMYDMFDKNASKYIGRITNDWNIEKYKGKENLSREEIIDALKIFRGEYGSSYIYFFRYPPYKELGSRMEDILKYKDIYRININDEELMKNIKDMDYGYNMSNTDNEKLDKSYYENITKEEYFSKYDDSLKMNYSTLNHISISFMNDYLDKKYITKINE